MSWSKLEMVKAFQMGVSTELKINRTYNCIIGLYESTIKLQFNIFN